MKKVIFLLSIAAGLACTSSFAQSRDNMTQADMNIESYEEYQKVDKELNKVYKQLTSKLEPHQKKLLVESQRQWIKFRDADCDFVASEFEGGSVQPLVINECMTERTKTRIKELKEMLNDR